MQEVAEEISEHKKKTPEKTDSFLESWIKGRLWEKVC